MPEIDNIQDLQPLDGVGIEIPSDVLDAGRPVDLVQAQDQTVAHPNAATIANPAMKAKIFTRFVILAAWKAANGELKSAFIAPGQIFPVYRKKGNRMECVLQALEVRAYSIPLYEEEVFVIGETKPGYKDLSTLPDWDRERDMIMSAPGGETIIRPHPNIPGLLPIKGYDKIKSRTPMPPMARRTAMQAGDFINLFGNMPLIDAPGNGKSLPFSFVKAEELGASTATPNMSGLFCSDTVAANPLTERQMQIQEKVYLPISFAYGDELLKEDFSQASYEAGITHYLEDHESVYMHHAMSPYADGNNDVLDSALEYALKEPYKLFQHDDLPPAAFVMKWVTKKKVSPWISVSPGCYDSARRFTSGQYNPVGA